MLEALIFAAVVIGLGGWAVYIDRRNAKSLRRERTEAAGLKAVEAALHPKPKKPRKKANKKR